MQKPGVPFRLGVHSGVDFPGFLDSRETGIFPEFSGFPGKFPGKL